MPNLKKYLRPVVIYEDAPVMELPDITTILNSNKFKNGGVRKFNTGGFETDPIDPAGETVELSENDKAWHTFIDNNPDYTFQDHSYDQKYVLGNNGQWIMNPSNLREVPVFGEGEDASNFDYEKYTSDLATQENADLKQLNEYDAYWRSEQKRMEGAATLHPSNPDWNPGLRVGPYSVTQGMEQDRLNSMPSHHPSYNQDKVSSYNQYYSDLVDKQHTQRRIGQESMDKINTFTGNLYKSLADPFINAPARLVTYGLNEAFGDGTETVDLRSPMFRGGSMDESGSLQDYNPGSDEVIPGHENRNSFANGAIRMFTDPYTFVGGGAGYKQLPKILQKGLKDAPKNIANSTYKTLKNSLKENASKTVKGVQQITNNKQAYSYLNPLTRTVTGLGNSLYYSGKTAMLPYAAASVGDFANRGLFSKEGVTWQDAQDTSFDLLDARIPFSSMVRDGYKGAMRDYQEGQFMSSKGIPYYASAFTQSKNPYSLLANATAKGYRTLNSYINDYSGDGEYDAANPTRLPYFNNNDSGLDSLGNEIITE